MTTPTIPTPAGPRTLDWRLRLDERSLRHKVATGRAPRARAWRKYYTLNQGKEGACTGFGTTHALLSTPHSLADRLDPQPRSTRTLEAVAFELYKEAQRRDQWAGENYEGSSVLGVMLAARAAGHITGFTWATTMDELILGVGHDGPAVIGVPWLEGMVDADPAGYVHATGAEVGGHCLEVIAVDPTARHFTLANSWGPRWSRGGSCRISFADMDILRRMGGEFAFPRIT